MASYITRSGILNFYLQKFDDSVRNLNEAEKIIKKLVATDPEAKQRLDEINTIRK